MLLPSPYKNKCFLCYVFVYIKVVARWLRAYCPRIPYFVQCKIYKQSPLMKPTLTGWGGLTKRFQPAHQQEEVVKAMLLRSSRTNKFSLCQCQRLDSKRKTLDWSSLLHFSIFPSLVGFRARPTYIVYQYISPFAGSICHIVFSPVCQLLEVRLWRWNMTFLETEMKELRKSTRYNIHNTR